MRRGRTEHDADDLVQESWVRLAQYARQQPVARPEAFLMRTALNLLVDAHRIRVSHGEEVLLEEVVLVDPMPDPEATLLARERMTRLSVCLGRLSDKTREIFLAHRVDGMTCQEIARREQLTVSTVEKHVAKGALLVTTWMEGR
jgi:RNA polymerase sigma-70 factor (ECF subfamily)